jgi:predicted MFS family arabinose efflux permease
VFAVVALPGLLLAFGMARLLRHPPTPAPRAPAAEPAAGAGWRQVLSLRAVRVNTALMMCSLTCLITLSAFMPSYLTDHLHLELNVMGMVLASQGLGSLLGMVTVPALSDGLGRKPVVVAALLIELVALLWLPRIGAVPTELFAALFLITFLNSGVVAITVGPLTSEAVPAALVSSATGMVVGMGEIVGGAVAPAIAGALAQHSGITVVPTMALVAIALGLGISLLSSGARRLPKLGTEWPR